MLGCASFLTPKRVVRQAAADIFQLEWPPLSPISRLAAWILFFHSSRTSTRSIQSQSHSTIYLQPITFLLRPSFVVPGQSLATHRNCIVHSQRGIAFVPPHTTDLLFPRPTSHCHYPIETTRPGLVTPILGAYLSSLQPDTGISDCVKDVKMGWLTKASLLLTAAIATADAAQLQCGGGVLCPKETPCCSRTPAVMSTGRNRNGC